MPYIEIKTNVHCPEEKKNGISRLLGKEISLIPGKSENWLMTRVEDSLSMTFAGTDEPCVMAEVSIFGKATSSAYDALTASLCEKLGDALGVPENRVYVKYSEVSVWGWNGSNF